jgi:hypothetical protein
MEIFGTNIDLNGNEIKKLRAENSLTYPVLGVDDGGRIIFNTAQKKFYGWTGTEWVLLNT